ncbi:hypothetical protein ACIBBG_33945 [Micromonospora chersina]|uniref:hypothetical protein n=1 Tax=Micromonospora chersina TaxID=47854 RepID=UPI003789F683
MDMLSEPVAPRIRSGTSVQLDVVSASSSCGASAASVLPGGGELQQFLDRGAEALYADGDLNASREWFDKAYRAADLERDWEALGVAALGYAGLWVHEHRHSVASTLVEMRLCRALALARRPSPVAVRLRARLAAEADYSSGEPSRILAVVDEARGSGDLISLADALSLAHHCALGPDHGSLRRLLAAELMEVGLLSTRRSDLLMGLLQRTVNLFLDADPHVERCLEELRGMLGRVDHLAIRFSVQAIDVMRAIRSGDLTEAEALAASCVQRGRLAGDADVIGWHGAHLIAINWFRGRIDELLPMLRELVNSPMLSPVDSSIAAALAVSAATAGDHRLAEGALARLRGQSLASLPKAGSWLVTMYGIVEAAYLLDDVGLSAEAYVLLEPHANLPMMASLGVVCFGSVHHALGVASMTMGATDQSIIHFQAALQANQALGNWPAAVLSRARLAQALIHRSGSGDLLAAKKEQETSDREAAQFGMVLRDFDLRTGKALVPSEPLESSQGKSIECKRRGLQWEVIFGDRAVVVKDSRGMAYISSLVNNPGYEIPAVDLVAGLGASARTTLGAADNASGQQVLDATAKQAYRQRLAELDAAIEEFETMHDVVRAERSRYERSWLIDELAAATGLGGRTRHFSDGGERARISVGKAIRRALAQIKAIDPAIGEHLSTHIRTGMRCYYLTTDGTAAGLVDSRG